MVWFLKKQWKRFWTEYRLDRRHNRSVRLARARYASQKDLKLNLACGPNPKKGWVNVDLFAEQADLQLDLCHLWPFADQSATYIYSEHFFEHLEYPGSAMRYLKESWRILQPGGRIRLVMPDAEPALIAYGKKDAEFFRRQREKWHPAWCDTWMHQVNYIFRQREEHKGDGPPGEEHQYAYDYETLASILQKAGFVDIVRSKFDPAMDTREGDLYVEGSKPAV